KARLVSELAGSAGDFYDGLVNGLIDPRMLLDDFKVRYRGALDEYRLARLKAHPRWLERLAGSLKAVEAEKWVLVFLQNERLPLLRRDGRLMSGAPARIKSDLERFMEESERQLRLGSDVIGYFRDLRPLFIGANATYHLFLSDAAGEILPDEHLGWQPVFSSWEGAFRQISVDTGGRVANTTRLAAALDAAASSEDVYYVLTYQPAEGQDRKRDIKIEMKRPGLRAVYSRKLTLGEIFPLKISAMEWQDGVLKIGLGDYQRLYGDEGLRGRLGISIRAEAKGREALVSTREIFPRDPLISVEMGLDLPAPGRYRLEVEVHDLWTGNKARAAKSIEISPPPAAEDGAGPEEAPELAALLDRAAEYCRKLKEGAFRFYCLEKVQEKVLQENPLQRVVQPLKRSWHYDYQIVGAGGQIKEQRRLVLDGTRKVDKANASLETRFAAHYSVFLPVTLLAVENRPLYHYRLAGSETLGKRACAVVEAAPRDPERGGISHGRIWIDEEDGSVLKVEMNPRGVAGSQALEEEARRMSAELILEATHWYLVAHEGLRFPSKIEFVETYRFDKGRQTRVRRDFDQNVAFPQPLLETTVRTVEFYRLSQEYEGYRFFAVQSREEIQPPQ
ncbi:MAG: hypothetical protein JXO51_00210, partial [Candidatus Aminicenantes bacterium]|nr:hypothetical protein [Candidatus Aminicenantes bacterium]